VAVLVGVALAAMRPIDDPDFWWLLAGGRYMAQTGRLALADPFSATATGAEWLNHAWAFELILYGVHVVAGLAGVIVLQGIVAAASFGVLYGLLRREGVGRGWALALLGVGAAATHGFWAPRPQLATYLLLAVFCRVLADYQAGRANRLVWLLPLTAAWANLHAGFLAGPGVVALAAAGELAGWALEGAGTTGRDSLARARTLGRWLVLTLAASLLNPFHYHSLQFPFGVMADRQSQTWIAEWLSPPFGHPQVLVLEMLLGLMLLFSLGTARPVPRRDLVMLLPLVHLGVKSVRNTPLLVIVATPILGRALASCVTLRWAGLPMAARRAVALGAVGLVLSSCTLVAGSRRPSAIWQAFRPDFSPAATLPAGAVAFLREQGRPGTLLNEYTWGGFLIWHLYPRFRVSIDGRMAVYGTARFAEHVRIVELQPGWREALDHLGAETALVRSGSSIVAGLRAAGWAVRYEDRLATVLERPGQPS